MVFTIDNLVKKYGERKVLDDITLQVSKGEIISIIGPSGSGKTTLLKIIANIESPTSGTVRFSVPPSRENPVILVFQNYILFPHLTVFENIAFGLKARKMKRKMIREKVMDFLSYFNITDKAESYPAHLSAGQMQRAAIARAMIVNPSVLLLDEPFANLDKNLKIETAEFIRKTQKDFNTTTISVTHDLEEAFSMSDKIGILIDGKLAQSGPVDDIYFRPRSYEVARFLGPVNIIPRGLFHVLNIPDRAGLMCVYSRAEALEIEKDVRGKGVITDICFIGLMILYRIRLEGYELQAYSLRDTVSRGDTVSVKITSYFT